MDVIFKAFDRWILSLVGGGGLFTFMLSHRGVSYFQDRMFYPQNYADSQLLFWIIFLSLYGVAVFITMLFHRFFKKSLHEKFEKNPKALNILGIDSVRNGLVLSGLILSFGITLVVIDLTLLNVWDVLFFIIFVGLYYIGTYLHYYYSVPLKLWKADDPCIELEKLKIEYEEQRMYLRIFLWITVSFLVSQVFVVLKSRFEPYLENPDKYSYLEPIMVINALQISFLIVTIWVLVFSQVMKRMESVKFELMSLRLPDKIDIKKEDMHNDSDIVRSNIDGELDL
jgi:MFS family permease